MKDLYAFHFQPNNGCLSEKIRKYQVVFCRGASHYTGVDAFPLDFRTAKSYANNSAVTKYKINRMTLSPKFTSLHEVDALSKNKTRRGERFPPNLNSLFYCCSMCCLLIESLFFINILMLIPILPK